MTTPDFYGNGKCAYKLYGFLKKNKSNKKRKAKTILICYKKNVAIWFMIEVEKEKEVRLYGFDGGVDCGGCGGRRARFWAYRQQKKVRDRRCV